MRSVSRSSPPTPDLVNLADEMGFLLFVEAGIDWIPNEMLANESYRNVIQHSVDKLVAQYRNNVSRVRVGDRLPA